MDFPSFAQGNFWASSEVVDGALQQPPPVANTHRLVRDPPSYSEIPQQKRPRNVDNISHLRNPGIGNKEATDFAYTMGHDHHWEFGGSGNCNYRGMNRFWNGVGDSKLSVCHEMSRNYNAVRRVQHGMGLCKFIFRGQGCPYGEICNFLHERMGKWGENSRAPDERWEKDEFSLGSMWSDAISIKISNCEDSSLVTGECRSSRMLSWKTRLCNKFEMHGTCPYDMRCIFAHGQAELRENVAFASAPASNCSSTSRTDHKGTLKCEARVGSSSEQVLEKHSSFKWDRLRKIVGIYADWIDENPMSQHCSFNDDARC